MKNKSYILITALIAVVTLYLLAAVLVRAFLPAWIIPGWSIPFMTLLSLAALLLDHYAAKDARRCYVCIPIFAAAAFGLLPFLCGFIRPEDILKYAVSGAAVFSVVTWLFTSIQTRLSAGPAKKAAPIMSALGLYLAFQCFSGMIL